jgi:mycofactocin system creatininase family protein
VTELKNLTWPEAELLQRDILIVPLGSIEQHGPHLPLDTDSVIATALAHELHTLRTTSGLAPTVAYGASGEHRDFAGTLSIGTPALTLLLTEIIRDASRYWRAVLFVNGHGGNSEALNAALLLARSESRDVAVVGIKGDSTDTHAGYQETSLMLHLDPARVLLDRLEVGNTAPLHQLLPTMQESGVRAISANGVLGDPTKASAALGASLLKDAVNSACATYDALLASLR